jgi:hypothetical protein
MSGTVATVRAGWLKSRDDIWPFQGPTGNCRFIDARVSPTGSIDGR